MRTSMIFPIRFWALVLACLLLYQFSTEASADWCKFEKEIDLTMDVSASRLLAISAAAGDLEIVGVSGAKEVTIHGKACASEESWLEESGLSTTTGQRSEIFVNLPDVSGGWSLWGNRYASLDLHIEVPTELALDIKDSSGDVLLKNTAAVKLQDSSGDIEIVDSLGPVNIRDSSGDIDIDGSDGDITIEADSSGDILVEGIKGSVLVKRDSSGDIQISDIRNNVIIERDSSGDISANEIGGDFRVLSDGSGSIRSNDVEGDVQIPEKG